MNVREIEFKTDLWQHYKRLTNSSQFTHILFEHIHDLIL